MKLHSKTVSRTLIAVVAATTLSVSLAACSSGSSTPTASPKPTRTADSLLVPPTVNIAGQIACSGDFGAAPNQYLDTSGQQKGLNIDIMNGVGKALDVPVKFVNIPFGSQIAALQAGRVDIMCTSTIVNPARLQVLYMVPYVQWGRGFLEQSNSKISIDCPTKDMSTPDCYDQLAGLTIVTGTGSVENTDLTNWNKELLAAGKKGITIKAFDTQSDAAAAMVRGEGDLSYNEDPQLAYFKQQFGSKVKIAFKNYSISPVALAFVKDPAHLVLAQEVEKALNSMKKDGSYAAIVKKWNLTAVDSFDFAQ
jgi:polar amino acid transport system substrate-binding protein